MPLSPYQKHVIKNTAIVALIFVVADVAAAHLYSFVSSNDRLEVLRNNEAHLRTPHEIYNHDLVPNANAEVPWGDHAFRIVTNDLGFRDRAYRHILTKSNAYRVLFMGDSFTEGSGVEYDNTFSGRLSTQFDKHCIQFLNAGVVSYSPAIYFIKTKYLLETKNLDIDSLFVFLDISDIEDEALIYRIENNRVVSTDFRRFFQVSKKVDNSLERRIKEFLKSNSVTLRMMDVLKDMIERSLDDHPHRTKTEIELGIGNPRDRWTLDNDLFEAWGAEGLRRASANMQHLLDLLRHHGVEMVVFVYPHPDQVYSRDLDSRQVIFWRNWSHNHHVHFVNLFPRFMTEDNAVTSIRRYFIHGDVHWNENGHAVVAAAVREELPERILRGCSQLIGNTNLDPPFSNP